MKLNFQNNRGSRRQSAHSGLSGLTSAATGCGDSKNLQSSRRGAGNSQFTIHNSQFERGMALVITLILLSVTLVMAIAFLAISRRERGSVTTSTDTATARLAADSGLAAAEGQIIANILATKNSYNYGLLVSANFINANGFDPALGANLINVGYTYSNGAPLNNVADIEQNLANLYYSPRPPVFVNTNSGSPLDFRFYLDLNRNGTFDLNGSIVNVDNQGNVLKNADGSTMVTPEVGDPEWIGVLERPDANYAPNNQFLSRYAFIALPVGNGYDLNYIHNQAATAGLDPLNDGYMRNEGVGSWEINLAAFLADLNTNQWEPIVNPYQYNQPATPNRGVAFEDALSLLSYRYATNYNSLATMQATLGVGFSDYLNGNIDLYTAGNLMTNTQLPIVNYQNSDPSWAGSDNTNHFFDLTTDLFDTNKTEIGVSGPGFTDRLTQTGTNTFGGSTVSTYDRYTFYRLLAQLGTDSTPESGKMNLNYDNLDLGSNGFLNVNGTASATNFVPWTPLGFYTNAADRMLKLYTANWLASDYYDYTNTFGGVTNAFGVANIPVLVNGQFVYSPAVQRVLQLAANIYDAVYYTNNYFPISGSTSTPYLPSVFQPIFNVTNGNVYISSFNEVTDTSVLANTLLNLNNGTSVVATLASHTTDLVFGVPLIIGAKKGFPNFNQFAMQSAFGLGRKLQITRTSTNALASTYKINQMFFVSLTNQLGVECWNSYSNYYTRPVTIFATNYLMLTLTNDEGFIYPALPVIWTFGSSTNLTVWPAFDVKSPGTSFQIPLNVNFGFISNSIYRFNPQSLIPDSTNATFETGVNGSSSPNLQQPQWGLAIANNLQVSIIDSGRIIDYVQLSGPNTNVDLNTGVDDTQNTGATGYNGMWVTNVSNGMPAGVANQLNVSKGSIALQNSYWSSGGNPESEIDGFRAFYHLSSLYNVPGESNIIAAANSTNAWQVPFTPSTNFYSYITWQANDPLVHYLASDLNDAAPHGTPQNPLIATNIVNERYQPWGATMLTFQNADSDTNTFNLQFKDPLVRSSDNWDFPANKFPTVGWLGRVHRGTPWQTVYLKAGNILKEADPNNGFYADYGTNTWMNWTGDANPYDAANSGPLQDRYLFDLFTTAPNDNATRGQLSVNQTHFAAWSALFSGMIVPTNLVGGYTVVDPGGANGTNSPVFQLFNNITNMASAYTTTASTGGAFTHIGDVLSAAALTEQSPFLNWSAAQSDPNGGNLNDELYEWLPQQMMSLLRVSTVPSFVIYSYGQTLAPAPNSVLAGGGAFSGMVTNYQVVAETITRTRVDFVPTTNNDGTITGAHAVIRSFNILPPN
jgi:hypothetical protein